VNNVYGKKETSFKKKRNQKQRLAAEEPVLGGRLEVL
jgi:hypothetical protein